MSVSRRDNPIPVAAPLIGEDEIAEVVDTLRSDWITTGPKTQQFQRDFADYVGAPAALGVSSCTAALHLALLALGLGPGDAVITTTMTFCSTVHVIEHTGATPVLCDVDPETLNLDPAQVGGALERARQAGLTPRALIPVHFAGLPCDMEQLLPIAEREGLAVVEDAAHALPARYGHSMVGDVSGSVPRAVAYSFYATKTITTGEGGMLVGNPELVDEARVWSLHGMSRDAWKRYGAEGSWFYEVTRPGFKYNMTDIAASIGIHQLRRADEFHKRRTLLAERYDAGLSQIDGVDIPGRRADSDHAWHLYVLRLRTDRLALDRGRFIDELAQRGIGTSVHFIPIHLHPYYRDRYGLEADAFPVAKREYERMLSLPLHLRMTERDVDDVVEIVADIAAANQR